MSEFEHFLNYFQWVRFSGCSYFWPRNCKWLLWWKFYIYVCVSVCVCACVYVCVCVCEFILANIESCIFISLLAIFPKSESKSSCLQDSSDYFSNAGVYIVSILPLILSSSHFFSKPLRTIPSAPVMTSTFVTLTVNRFFSSRARS